MNIGFDLDNTLVRLNTVEVISKEKDLNYTMLDCDDWHFSSFPSEFRKLLVKAWADPDHMCSLAPINGSYEKILSLKDQGHKLYLITARMPEVRERTIEYIQCIFPNIFTDILFVDYNGSKQDLMKQLKLDIWVDDAPHECHAAYYNGIKVFMISNMDTRYNWYISKWNKINAIHSIRELNI